jgi:drug/metabolite transporter (DMT)-like permease
VVTTSSARGRVLPGPQTLAVLGLLAVTAVWGSTFFMIADIVTRIDVADLLAARFTIAALLLLPFALRALRRMSRRTVGYGVLLGLAYGVAQFLQTYGLAHTSPALSGFLTSMYVVLTPLLAFLMFRVRVGARVAIALLLAVTGVAVLTLRGGGLAIGIGELLTLAGAAVYAVHIVCLSRWSTPGEVFGLTAVQLLVLGGVSVLAALPHGIALPQSGRDIVVVLYLAIAAGVVAVLVQTWGQSHLSAARAAIVMCMEPVWAAGFAVALTAQALTGRLVLGGSSIVAGMLVAEVGSPGGGDAPPEPLPH